MASAETAQEGERNRPTDSPDDHDPVPGLVDWTVGTLVGLFGLVLSAVGVLVYTQTDEEILSDVITDLDAQPDGITQAELITAGSSFTDWLAIGFGVTGLTLIGVAALFIYRRRQTRRRVSRQGGTTATFLACAVYGAAAGSLISSVVPLVGTVAGGGVGASLSDADSGARVGAVTGILAFVLTIPLLLFMTVGSVAGGMAIDEGMLGAGLGALFVIAGIVGAVFNAGAGALGGYLADRFI